VTGLVELLGILCLFGLAPILVWKLWLQFDYEQEIVEETTPLADTQPVNVGLLYDQLAS
jgi:hypothetical protein